MNKKNHLKFDKRQDRQYVIFYCDDCHLLEPVTKVFSSLYTEITVMVVDDIHDMVREANAFSPELILIYLNQPDNRTMAIVKDIRDHLPNTTAPILVYKTLPEENDLKEIFSSRLGVTSPRGLDGFQHIQPKGDQTDAL